MKQKNFNNMWFIVSWLLQWFHKMPVFHFSKGIRKYYIKMNQDKATTWLLHPVRHFIDTPGVLISPIWKEIIKYGICTISWLLTDSPIKLWAAGHTGVKLNLLYRVFFVAYPFSSSDSEHEIPPVNTVTEKTGTNIQLGGKCFNNEFIKMTPSYFLWHIPAL